MTAAQSAALLEAGKITPMELVEEAIEKTERYQKDINAYITFLPEDARAQAQAVYEDMKKNGRKGELTGIPYSVKDLIFTKGIRTTAGSRQMKDYIPDEDSATVAAMKAEGAILMGKTNTQEWGCGPAGDQSFFGPVRNPWNTDLISGGSSSGSAASVAVGMTPVSIGSDAGGSIRIPASLCGVVGLKPSFGLVNGTGSFRGSIHLGCTGPIAGTVEDAAMMMDVIAGDTDGHKYTKAVRSQGNLRGVRIGVPGNLFRDNVQEGVLKVFEDSLDTLREEGAEVTEISIPWLEEIPELSCAITFPEIAYLHRERLEKDPDGYEPFIKARIEKGFGYSVMTYIEAMERRDMLMAKWKEFMTDYEAILMPTLPVTAYPVFAEKIEFNGIMTDASALLVRHTRAANVIGCPALTVPGGLSEGLPVGLMFMGHTGGDDRLLKLGNMFEKARPFERKF